MKKLLLLSLLFFGVLVSALHAQTITSVSPSQASPAVNVVQVTITGANLQGVTDASFSFPGSGISVSGTQAAQDGSRVVTNFNVCGAVPGTYNILGGPTSFTVTQSGPVINDTAPRDGAPGTTFQIAILGCALQNVSSIFAQTTGVSLSNISSNRTQVTATMTMDPSTPPGQFFILVANDIGTSNGILFDAVSGPGPQPSVSSLSTQSEPAGTTFNLTVTGSSLSGATAVNFTPSSGISATITQDSDSQVTAVVAIDSSATPGSYTVGVVTPAGISNSLNFTVGTGTGSSGPTISSLSPASVSAGGGKFWLTVNGSGFQSGATVQINGVTRTTSFVNSSQLSAKILASDIATAGNKPITVTNPPDGTSNSGGPVSNTVNLVVN